MRQFTPNARWVIVSQAISRLGFGVRQAIYNLFLLSLGYSTTFVGGILALGIYTMAIGALVAGPYTRKVGEKNALILSSLISGVTAAVQVAYPEPTILLFMTVLFNFGSSLQTSSYSPLMAESSSEYERTHLFGTSQASRIGSSFIGSALGGFLPGLFALWLVLPFDSPLTFQIALTIWFIPYIIGIFPLLFLKVNSLANKLNTSHDKNSNQSANLDSEPEFRVSIVLRFIVISALIGLGAGLIVPLINVWFWEFYNLPTPIVGLIVATGQATMATGVLLSPILSTRIGKVRTVVITQALSLPFIIVLATILNPYIAIASYLLRNALMNSGMPVGQTLRMELVPRRWRSNLAALNMSAQGFGRATSVQFVGQLFDQGQYLLPFWLTLIFYGLQVVLYAIFFRNAEKLIKKPLELKPKERAFGTRLGKFVKD
ncbi:MAG: MFS transporter [Candidatus Hodarchaeota archaeon]